MSDTPEVQETQIPTPESTSTEVQETPYSYLNDKFKVTKDDGALDIDGTLEKISKSYSELEKKFSGRQVLKAENVQEDLDLSEFDEDFLTNNKDLIELAKNSKLSKDTLKSLTDMYNQKVSSVLEFKEKEEYDTTIDTLEKLWGKDTEKQVEFARKAVIQLGLSSEEVDKVGNSPAFIKLAAALGAQLGEDKAPNINYSGASLRELMSDPAYSNPKDPNHASVTQQVANLYAQGQTISS